MTIGESISGQDGALRAVTDLGRRIREKREGSGLTLRQVSEATGLSTSMLSLVERGQTSPSIGTLVSICDALSITMASLFSSGVEVRPVVIRSSETMSHSADGVTRRIVLDDRALGLEVSEHSYASGSTSGSVRTHHSGEEFGFIVSGYLHVELGESTFRLAPGDAVHFRSEVPHRFTNRGRGRARAIWINVNPKSGAPE